MASGIARELVVMPLIFAHQSGHLQRCHSLTPLPRHPTTQQAFGLLHRILHTRAPHPRSPDLDLRCTFLPAFQEAQKLSDDDPISGQQRSRQRKVSAINLQIPQPSLLWHASVRIDLCASTPTSLNTLTAKDLIPYDWLHGGLSVGTACLMSASDVYERRKVAVWQDLLPRTRRHGV